MKVFISSDQNFDTWTVANTHLKDCDDAAITKAYELAGRSKWRLRWLIGSYQIRFFKIKTSDGLYGILMKYKKEEFVYTVDEHESYKIICPLFPIKVNYELHTYC